MPMFKYLKELHRKDPYLWIWSGFVLCSIVDELNIWTRFFHANG